MKWRWRPLPWTSFWPVLQSLKNCSYIGNLLVRKNTRPYIYLTDTIAPAVESAARDAGFLVNAPAPDVIRLAPPLIITEEQAQGFVSALPSILDSAAAEGK